MPFGAQDVKIFFRDGVLAVANGKSTRVHLDFPEDVEQFGGMSRPGVVTAHPRMTYETAAIALNGGDKVTVAGTVYKVASTRKLDDGLISVADLNKA